MDGLQDFGLHQKMAEEAEERLSGNTVVEQVVQSVVKTTASAELEEIAYPHQDCDENRKVTA